MNKHLVFILTDSNRRYVEAIYSDNLLGSLQDIYTSHHHLNSSTVKLTRIVYMETFESQMIAKKRFQELNQYTRMQKERLIRRQNPNWLNLYPIRPLPVLHHKKVVVCA